jgi:hydrogenase maturation protease
VTRIVVAGLGSEYRRDDGLGPVVATRVSGDPDHGGGAGGVTDVGPLSDPLDLLGLWDGADLAVVVDAVRSGAVPGTVRVVEMGTGAAPGGGEGTGPEGVDGATSTHGIGLAGVLRLARATGRAPRRVVVVGVEGAEFGYGVGLSPAVEAAVPAAVAQVARLVGEVRSCA